MVRVPATRTSRSARDAPAARARPSPATAGSRSAEGSRRGAGGPLKRPGGPTFAERYNYALAEGGWRADAAQLAAVAHFEALEDRLWSAERERTGLAARTRRLLGLAGPGPRVKGLYLWGGVGRGKTFLLDLFCAHVGLPVQRNHYHHFMRALHQRLHGVPDVQDPLLRIAAAIGARYRALCFDELFVSDIADAMLLGTLFAALVDRGVALVFTSNTPPSGLYADGLQRARFLPAIAMLEQHTDVCAMDSGVDYRLRELRREPIWLVTAAGEADTALARRLALLGGEGSVGAGTLDLGGRPVATRLQTATAAWFDFTDLCEGPRGVEDYIAIAERFGVVAVSGIPVLGPEADDAARRFIALVDEFYDRGVKLLASAAALPADLYRGTRLEFAFRRTISRLTEMQTAEYLARPHRVDALEPGTTVA